MQNNILLTICFCTGLFLAIEPLELPISYPNKTTAFQKVQEGSDTTVHLKDFTRKNLDDSTTYPWF